MKYIDTPTLHKKGRLAAASALMLGLAVTTYAQQTSAQNDEEIVRLSPFSVQESADIGRYQAVEASSGTRVRMNLMDSTQSISVVTSPMNH